MCAYIFKDSNIARISSAGLHRSRKIIYSIQNNLSWQHSTIGFTSYRVTGKYLVKHAYEQNQINITK